MSGDCELEPDRARAIDAAIAGAADADVVLIAGKGHESYQEIAGRRHAFSDVAVARDALRRGGRA
jgi:UDP-N-acetylmuramoyl-L-alanyl-D-glutamate--2,6-diaminopimelate ligase